MKLGTWTNSDILNSMVMFICSASDRKYTLGSKNENGLFFTMMCDVRKMKQVLKKS